MGNWPLLSLYYYTIILMVWGLSAVLGGRCLLSSINGNSIWATDLWLDDVRNCFSCNCEVVNDMALFR